MQAERKKIIQYALEYEINDVNTYSGYKGDLIVKITTKDKNTALALRDFAISLSVKEVVIKQNLDLNRFEVFCVTPDKDVYHIKEEENILNEVHSEHPFKDVWNGSK